jgi:hypothetical protein
MTSHAISAVTPYAMWREHHLRNISDPETVHTSDSVLQRFRNYGVLYASA